MFYTYRLGKSPGTGWKAGESGALDAPKKKKKKGSLHLTRIEKPNPALTDTPTYVPTIDHMIGYIITVGFVQSMILMVDPSPYFCRGSGCIFSPKDWLILFSRCRPLDRAQHTLQGTMNSFVHRSARSSKRRLPDLTVDSLEGRGIILLPQRCNPSPFLWWWPPHWVADVEIAVLLVAVTALMLGALIMCRMGYQSAEKPYPKWKRWERTFTFTSLR